jgi:hypothetical protein
MRANQAYPKRFLAAADVKERPRVAVISRLAKEEVGKGDEATEKWALFFEDGVKPIILNRTNWEILEDAFGDSDDWPGHKVKIKCARTLFQGKMTDCIRLEAIAPKPAPKQEVDPELDDEVAA